MSGWSWHDGAMSPGRTAPSAPRDTHELLHHTAPDAAVDAALDDLRAHGQRVTEARRAVLDVLAKTPEHVSADQVAGLLAATHPHVHRATVYRTLDTLVEVGLVSHMHGSGGATLYHFASAGEGHGHLHARCRNCGRVIVLDADVLSEASARAARDTGFRLEPAQSVLVGLCDSCRA
jgi:Fur family transcriptional regulator, ferric uptake regulator